MPSSPGLVNHCVMLSFVEVQQMEEQPICHTTIPQLKPLSWGTLREGAVMEGSPLEKDLQGSWTTISVMDPGSPLTPGKCLHRVGAPGGTATLLWWLTLGTRNSWPELHGGILHSIHGPSVRAASPTMMSSHPWDTTIYRPAKSVSAEDLEAETPLTLAKNLTNFSYGFSLCARETRQSCFDWSRL
ncbi:uncharacterized protein [Struthio camelus]|uniref:uncharacterized protein isoform X3 n=1 Tax=Struthio camelus TaxID=8801 RepID=UPI003603B056